MSKDLAVLSKIKANLHGEFEPFDIAPIKLTVSVIAFIVHLGFLFLFYFLNIIELVVFNIFSLAAWWWAIIESIKTNYFKATLIGSIEIIAHASYATMLLGDSVGFNLYLWSLLAWLAFSFTHKDIHGVLTGLVCVAMLLFLSLFDELNLISPSYTFSDNLSLSLFILNMLCASGLIVVTTYFIRKSVESQKIQLETLATHDQLTNLYNRHYFVSFIHQYRNKAIRDKEPFCIVMADIDYFKQINDEHGHVIGDQIIKQLADHLKQALRVNDVVARWGGEEFLIVLVNCTLDEGVKRIDNLRQDISELTLVETDNTSISITVSFGVAQFKNEQPVDDLISDADALLFSAKRAGRNRVKSN